MIHSKARNTVLVIGMIIIILAAVAFVAVGMTTRGYHDMQMNCELG
jgi:hypothetical protein